MQREADFTKSFTIQDINNGPMNLSCISFSPLGNQLAVGGFSTVLWDLERDCELKQFFGLSPSPYNIAFDNTGYLLAVSGSFSVPIWNIKTGRAVLDTSATLKILERKGTALNVAFSTDGRFLAAGGYDSRVVNVWEISSGKEIYQIEHYKDAVKALSFDANNNYIVTGDLGGNVRLWDMKQQQEFWSFENIGRKVRDIAVSSSQSRLAVAYDNGIVQLWDFEIRELRSECRHFSDINNIRFCPSDENILAIGGRDNLVILWDALNNKLIGRFETVSRVVGIDFSPGGTLLAIASERGKVYLWRWS